MRSYLRFASVVGAFALSTVAIAPAMAASPVSQAGANAVTLSVAGNAQRTGDVTATNDGTTETKKGDATPPLSVLGGQHLLRAGVLAQEATARADGTSAACAGLAGQGGSVLNIGGSSCLQPGDAVNASLGSLDLSGLVVVNADSALSPINGLTQQLTDQIAPLITQVITATGGQFDALGLTAGLGLVEGSCTARLGSATGDATLADAGISLSVPGKTLTLLDLPLHPAPNTHLSTNLSDVLDMIVKGVETDLNTSFDAQLAPLKLALAPIRDEIITNVRTQLESKLAPLEQNILDVTLNRQIVSGDSIKVRALDLSLLPVVKAQLGSPLVNLQVGNAACGPSGRISAVEAPQAAAPPPAMPTSVSAGYATMPAKYAGQSDDFPTNAVVLGAFALLMASAAGFLTFRRLNG